MMTEIAPQQQHGGQGQQQQQQQQDHQGSGKLTGKDSSGVSSRRSTSPLRQLVGFRKLGAMWHPHVYQTPVLGPTPFSIDDILNAR